jgi:hypothetical protein
MAFHWPGPCSAWRRDVIGYRMDSDALQRITTAVTPAVMVSACGLIALGLDNQASRVSLRLRDLAREFREPGAQPGRQQVIRQEVAVLGRRHGIVVQALLLNYVALLAFVVTSLLSIAQGLLRVPPDVTLAVFLVGVLTLSATAILAIASGLRARAALILEQDAVLGSWKAAAIGTERGPAGAS